MKCRRAAAVGIAVLVASGCGGDGGGGGADRDAASSQEFDSPSDVASFLSSSSIDCQNYHDFDPSSVETYARAEGACSFGGSAANDLELLVFASSADRDSWASAIHETFGSADACAQVGPDTTTTFVLGANWAAISEVSQADADPVMDQIAQVTDTTPAQLCAAT